MSTNLSITPINHALVSVFDKTNLDKLAQLFVQYSIKVISTGGSAQYLRAHGVEVLDASIMGLYPEMLDGRVKTLNPHIFGGILFDRSKDEHRHTIESRAIPTIDLVVVNFYPFERMAQNHDRAHNELIECIDIGGPSMLRAAAKNAAFVTALSGPHLYDDFVAHYQTHQGTTLAYRQARASEVFRHTAHYDQAIASALQHHMDKNPDVHAAAINELHPPHELILNQAPVKKLRYGENPHQSAKLYSSSLSDGQIHLAGLESLQGKELSYNNLLDTHAAIWSLRCLAASQSEELHQAVVIKHGTPCGAACAQTPEQALSLALASDAKSAFGGIIAQSSPFDESCLWALKDNFAEIIIAPHVSDDALIALGRRKNLRLLIIPHLMSAKLDSLAARSIFGGMLIQDQDSANLDMSSWEIVTKQKPHEHDLLAMKFAFSIAKAAPSNAIALAYTNQLIGVGAGQPSRIQALEIALNGAHARGFSLEHAALASDAFFPFHDCLSLASEHGIKRIIQPGGSIKDAEIIAHANDLGLCMLFSHKRHFRH